MRFAEAAFDVHAAGYDAVALSDLGTALRRRVHTVLEQFITPTDIVVDLGCGTGIDAAWLASRAGSVIAVDESSAMIERARERCAALGNVSFERAAATELELAGVDVVLANFGVVNCVGDLHRFGAALESILVPGGHLVAVSMVRWCPIELAHGALRLDRRLLGRRRHGPVADPRYHGVTLRYASARDLERFLHDGFRLQFREALGIALPPFELRRFVENRPRTLRWLDILDRRAARFGAAIGIGDHHIAVLQRRGDRV